MYLCGYESLSYVAFGPVTHHHRVCADLSPLTLLSLSCPVTQPGGLWCLLGENYLHFKMPGNLARESGPMCWNGESRLSSICFTFSSTERTDSFQPTAGVVPLCPCPCHSGHAGGIAPRPPCLGPDHSLLVDRWSGSRDFGQITVALQFELPRKTSIKTFLVSLLFHFPFSTRLWGQLVQRKKIT